MSELVPLDNLASDLDTATRGGKSGAFFITTEDQHSAMITLRDGTITGFKFRSARGYDAASALARVARMRYQTAAEPTELPGDTALDTRSVLEILRGAGRAPASDESPEPDAAATAEPLIDLDALRNRYIGAIGPVAGALFDEAVEETGDSLSSTEGANRFIEKLAAQIDDAAEAESFVQDARSGFRNR